MKYFALFFLLVGVCAGTAVTPLSPGIYTGLWMGSPGGFRRSDDVRLTIDSNQWVLVSYSQTDPITGSPVIRYFPARFVSERVLRQRGNRAPVFRAVQQGGENSVRGWFRIGGRRVIFYAHYRGPLPPEQE
jgi:hypothetical protein